MSIQTARTICYSALFGIFAALLGSLDFADRLWFNNAVGNHNFGLISVVLAWVVSELTTKFLFRRLGVPLQSPKAQTTDLQNIVVNAEVESSLHVSSFNWLMPLGLGLLTIGMEIPTGILLFVSHFPSVYLSIAFAFLSTLFLVGWGFALYFCSLTVRADERGLTQTSDLLRLKKFVAWPEIASGELVTAYDESGNAGASACTLKNRNGKRMLYLPLANVSASDRNKLLALLKSRLKPQNEQ